MAENQFLASLSSADFDLIKPALSEVRLASGFILSEAGGTITKVYFPIDAVVSLVVGLSTGEMIETAMVGRDGIVSAAAALDSKVSINRAIVQIEGSAIACSPDALKTAATQSRTLHGKLIRHEQVVHAQAQQSAACIAAHQASSRLCKWLLRARDLSGKENLHFTHEFLSEMLGVQRSSVSLVAGTLQTAGFIKYSRGNIRILSDEGLKETVCECYEAVKENYRKLLDET
jgi:CRP-like cAMP-binding protein